MESKAAVSNRFVEVLVVEDNPTDAYLTREALQHSRFVMDINVADDGEEALDYLHHTGRFSHSIEPDLVLLDLNLPKKNGWAVLGEIRRTPALSRIPVVILTSSKSDSDARMAREMKADLFIVKPPDVSHFPVLVNSLEHLLEKPLKRGA